MKSKLLQQQRGFTLLELLIALVLVAFISFFTAQTLRSTMSSSKKIQGDIDINSEIQSAINLIKSDVARAFNSRDIYIAVYNEAQREHIRRWKEESNKPAGTPDPKAGTGDTGEKNPDGTPKPPGAPAIPGVTQPKGPPPEYKPRPELTLTQFIGEKDRLDFTSINGNSIRKNASTSELVEIGYDVKKCRRRGRNAKDTECLWRRLSYYLDGEVIEGGQNSVLIEDVTLFEIKYLRKQNEQDFLWQDTWPLDNPETQNQLPLAVEVTLEVSKSTDKSNDDIKKKRVVAYIPIDFENNSNIKKIIEMNAKGNPMDEAATNQNGFDGYGESNDGGMGGENEPAM